MRIAVGSDHAGFTLKETIVRVLDEEGLEVRDFGVFSPDRMDYPDVGLPVAEAVAAGEFDRGILVCGTGIGMSIVANKVPGIRAALVTSEYQAEVTRTHNDSNILVLGERVTDPETAKRIVRIWLTTDFSGEERHANRIEKITGIDSKYRKGVG